MIEIDIPNLVVGGVLGGAIGYGANTLQQFVERPRVRQTGFLKRTPQYEAGDLYKVWFKLGGKRGPGVSSMELTYREPGRAPASCFAKFDEAPIPYGPDGNYWPHMVPLTYQQVLHIGRVYTVPLIHVSGSGIFLFNGWWYGRNSQQYNESAFQISDAGYIEIDLSGEELRWTKKIGVAKLIDSAPGAPLADSGDKQAAIQEFVRNQSSP